MSRRISRRWIRRWVFGIFLIVVVVSIGRPALHLASVAIRDRDDRTPVPAGFIDDASRLNLTDVNKVISVPADLSRAREEIAALLQRAAAQGMRVSIAGAQHTMGGHTIYPGGIVLNMRPFNRIELDPDGVTLHAGAGATWSDIIPYLEQLGRSIEIMQSNNSFTVGGSISVNCHGWQHNRPPIASTIEKFTLMRSDGSIVTCSRNENAELFSLALGGYGLFGIILDVDVRTVPNEQFRLDRFIIETDQFIDVFAREVADRTDVGMVYARLCVTKDDFLRQAVLNVFRKSPCPVDEIPSLDDSPLPGLKRTLFRGSVDSDYGKRFRWNMERMFSDQLGSKVVSRNQLLNEGVDLYQDRSDATTDILHEYFVPPEGFAEFIDELARIIPQHGGDLLNATVRHVQEDSDTFLRYADQEMFSFVLLFSQARDDEGDRRMQAMTQDLIDAALGLGGRYYLPYRLHASVEQFDAAYPQGRTFFEIKRKYDPAEIFQNHFYVKYGKRDDGVHAED